MTPSEVRTEEAELEAVADSPFTPRRRGTRKRAFLIILFAILFGIRLSRVSMLYYKLDRDCFESFLLVVIVME